MALQEVKPPIAVVDDDFGVLRSVERLLRFHGFDVKGYSTPQALLTEVEALSPGCIVADISMPGLTGLDLQRELADSHLDYPMIFITGYGDIRTSVLAMRAGAIDFLTKPFDQTELLNAVERALLRSGSAREAQGKLALFRQRIASLTQREREVFERVVAGYLNKQIAADLGIAEKTVKVHRSRVMQKMAVKSVAQLARVAEQIGIGVPAWECAHARGALKLSGSGPATRLMQPGTMQQPLPGH